MDNHRQPVYVGGAWPHFCVTVDALESGKTVVRIMSDNEQIDSLLEAMGIKAKFSISNQMDVAEVTPAQAIELLQRFFGGAAGAQPKRQLTDKQRQARATNAAKARQKRHAG